jgi:NTE family protein
VVNPRNAPPGAPTIGMVLSGGAARGAYQAGVLRYLFRTLPKELGFAPWPQVVSGTSVGALNGLFAVARSELHLVYLSKVWRNLRIPEVFTLHYGDLFGALRGRWRGGPGAALLDPSPLYKLVEGLFPHEAARRAIDSGDCRAFVVSATELSSGHNVLFVDTADSTLDLAPLPRSRVVGERIVPRHLLASAALPFLFPPIEVGGRAYVDGGLRQNTPLHPILHAGAQKVLLIGAHSLAEEEPPAGESVVPTLPFLAGKSMNALMADPVERDLATASRLNRILEWGERTYGPEFLVKAEAELDLRKVQIHTIRPSLDLGRMAAEAYHRSPPADAPNLRWLLSMLADRPNGASSDSDLLSYLYFDRSFTAEAEDLGWKDAEAQKDALLQFFSVGASQHRPSLV